MGEAWFPRDGEPVWVVWYGCQVWGKTDGEPFLDGVAASNPNQQYVVDFDASQPCGCGCKMLTPCELFPLRWIHRADEVPTLEQLEIEGYGGKRGWARKLIASIDFGDNGNE